MSDSEEYSSEEDEDYLPSGEEYSEDDVNELVKEEEEEEKPSHREKCKKNSKEITCRKRNKGCGLFLEPGGGEASKDDESNSEDGESTESNPHMKESDKRQKEDALWASFLSDVGQKPKAPPAVQASGCTQKDKPAEVKNSCKPQEVVEGSEKSKVAITKVFDFAGEEVRVTKEVDATSEEARFFLKQQEQKTVVPASSPTVSGVKRPSGMNSLLGKIGTKKQKLSTLEKSKLDWETFKEEEGIGEELAIHNRGKDGYLERKAFLERVDHRQFEHERDIRLSNMKP
ncbi:Craniofacial development protein 1 [Podarcis lilfordi]|uniref:Craniofacial development protein 1 n=1 Tax=Podarcis lilfordi TaxID=74358 RepID=A0AA35KQX1_9SAUR|nr:Craniofacial development protein 1 [Podarcis lilfordi]